MVRKNPRKIPSKFPTKISKFPCKNYKKITDELLQERRQNVLCSDSQNKTLCAKTAVKSASENPRQKWPTKKMTRFQGSPRQTKPRKGRFASWFDANLGCFCEFGVIFSVRNVPVTPTPSIFPKVLPYKWGAYCRTNGGRTAVQMGGVLQGFPFFEA